MSSRISKIKQPAFRQNDDRIQDMLHQQASDAGIDWAKDTLYDARNNPRVWQGGMNRYESPEEYVLGFGQDAAGDMSDSFLEYGEQEVMTWYRSLPKKEPNYWSDDAHRPTQSIMRDIVADYFYDGVSKAVKQAKAA